MQIAKLSQRGESNLTNGILMICAGGSIPIWKGIFGEDANDHWPIWEFGAFPAMLDFERHWPTNRPLGIESSPKGRSIGKVVELGESKVNPRIGRVQV